jgi:3-hydroxyacyl-CoA dehydrogenase
MNQQAHPAVAVSRRGPVLVAAMANPPVNALSAALRAGLWAALDEAERDAGVVGVVIAGNERMFSAGADVTELGKPMRDPQLGEIIAQLDGFAKPVVAAIGGGALGGGLELALACNARVAAGGAKLGLPEVKLGLLPGAGGIVRLPRLVGVEAALEVIAEGKDLSAKRAAELGLVDEVATGDVVDAAAALAQKLAADGKLPRASERPFPAFDEAAQAEAKKALAKKFRGREAPQVAVELFAMAAATPFAEAVPLERDACRALVLSPQSKALRHLFVAERAVAKPAAIPAGTEPRPVARSGVVGPGIMGRGIAIALLDAGLPVVLVGRSDKSLEAARAAIAKNYDGLIKRGSLTEEKKAERLARLSTATEIAALAGCDLVVETISEDLAAKREAIAEIDRVLSDRAVLVTNTSYLDVEDLARATTRPENFAGMHFFNPANIMKLVENVRTKAAAPDVLATLMAMSKKLGKTAVLVGPSEGFVANRMLSKRTREGLFLLQEGATPAQVDRVLSGFGFPVGPFTLADMAGLDLMAATRAARAAGMSERERGAAIAEALVAAGRLGRKNGRGYYAYSEDGKLSDDPAVAELLAKHRTERGITTRTISDEEVLERCLLALVNEGAKLIGEGAVERASDIDVIWTTGLGFPAHLGGPMFWASQMGLPKVLERLEHYARSVGDEFFAPADLVRKLAASNERFQ